MAANSIDFKKRSGKDRRVNNPPIFSKYLIIGKRRGLRRKEDHGVFQMVDRYSTKVGLIILFIIGLSLLDAIFTLILVEKGAEELNPIMAFFLALSPGWFVGVKYLLTSIAAVTVLIIKDAYLFQTETKAGILFFLIMVPFILVIPYQLHLLFSVF